MDTKDFEIAVWYRVGGTILVEAENREKAEEMALNALDDFGEGAISNADDRNWGVV